MAKGGSIVRPDIEVRENSRNNRAIRFTSTENVKEPIQDPLDVPPSSMFAPIPSNNDEVKDTSDTTMMVRRMHTDNCPPADTPILIVDSAADISMVGQGFKILFHTGENTTLWGAMASLDGKAYDIVSAATVIESPYTTQQYVIIINQAAYVPDSQQYESLLHTDQARYHNVTVNDLSKFFRNGHGNVGNQSVEVDGFEIPLQHDGSKYFFTIRKPRRLGYITNN